MVHDKFGMPVTDDRWEVVSLAIQAFIKDHPLAWQAWKRDMEMTRSKYNLATEGDLRKSGFRNSCSFPVVYRKIDKPEDGDWIDPSDDDTELVESLHEIIIAILPGLLEADKPGAPNKLFHEFLRRYPVFRPGEFS